jgi:hypothetical protein
MMSEGSTRIGFISWNGSDFLVSSRILETIFNGETVSGAFERNHQDLSFGERLLTGITPLSAVQEKSVFDYSLSTNHEQICFSVF